MTPSLLPNMKNAQAFKLLLSIYHNLKNIAIGEKRIFWNWGLHEQLAISKEQ
jgi:hypothetical protein